MVFFSYLISGISLGSVYAIIALGYTMVYGIAKMLNFAHGDVIMVGGYVCYCALSYLNLPAIVAVPRVRAFASSPCLADDEPNEPLLPDLAVDRCPERRVAAVCQQRCHCR